MSTTATTRETVGRGVVPARSTRRLLARTSAAGAAVFAAAAAVGGALNDGYSHRSDAISSLAAQDAHAAGVMTAGFVGLTVALLAAGGALLGGLRGKAATVGASLVLLAGAASVVVTGARLDCSPLTDAACVAQERAGTVSGSHVLHNLSSLVLFVLLCAGLFVLAAGLRRSPGALRLARPTRLAAAATLVLMVWFGSGAYGDNGGLVQKALLLASVGWTVLLAHRVSRLAQVEARA